MNIQIKEDDLYTWHDVILEKHAEFHNVYSKLIESLDRHEGTKDWYAKAIELYAQANITPNLFANISYPQRASDKRDVEKTVHVKNWREQSIARNYCKILSTKTITSLIYSHKQTQKQKDLQIFQTHYGHITRPP